MGERTPTKPSWWPWYRIVPVWGRSWSSYMDLRLTVCSSAWLANRSYAASTVSLGTRRPLHRVTGGLAVSASRLSFWRLSASSWSLDAEARRADSSSFASFHREGARYS